MLRGSRFKHPGRNNRQRRAQARMRLTNRRKRTPMMLARPMLKQRPEVLRRAVTGVGIETVKGVDFVQLQQHSVTRDFSQN